MMRARIQAFGWWRALDLLSAIALGIICAALAWRGEFAAAALNLLWAALCVVSMRFNLSGRLMGWYVRFLRALFLASALR